MCYYCRGIGVDCIYLVLYSRGENNSAPLRHMQHARKQGGFHGLYFRELASEYPSLLQEEGRNCHECDSKSSVFLYNINISYILTGKSRKI